VEYDLELGQDLNKSEIRDQLIEDLRSCQIFFNNSGVYQLELLNRAHALQNDLAIVVSSSSVASVAFYDYSLEKFQDNEPWIQYITQKRLLTDRCRQIQASQVLGQDQRSWILTVLLSWLDTYEHRLLDEHKMDPSDVAELIADLLFQWPKMAVQEITVIAPNRDLIA
jgi:hypothetical protein